MAGYGAARLLLDGDDKEYPVLVPGYNLHGIEKNLTNWAGVTDAAQAKDFKTMTPLQMRGVSSSNFFNPIVNALR